MRWLLLSCFTTIVFYFGCKDQITAPTIVERIYQLGKCNGSGLNKTLSADCFNYTFKDKLILDFCVQGNCCPDSNRFTFTHNIQNDQISIFITDIEQNLCKCNCSYVIHAEISNLKYDKYNVYCFQNKNGTNTILYNTIIQKN